MLREEAEEIIFRAPQNRVDGHEAEQGFVLRLHPPQNSSIQKLADALRACGAYYTVIEPEENMPEDRYILLHQAPATQVSQIIDDLTSMALNSFRDFGNQNPTS